MQPTVIGVVHFRLLGTSGFHVKAKNERFTAATPRCRQNLKYENFTSSFGRVRQNIAPKSVPHVHHDYFSSFNQSNHWFVALSLKLPSSNLKLLNRKLDKLMVNFHESVLCGNWNRKRDTEPANKPSTAKFGFRKWFDIFDIFHFCEQLSTFNMSIESVKFGRNRWLTL